MLFKTFLCLELLTVCTLTQVVQAAESGGSSYLPGFYGDFGMATMPAPGNYLSNFWGYNTASNSTDNSNLTLELPGLVHVTDQNILGGRYWFGFYPYVLRTESQSPGNHSTRGGAGDMYALPIALSWQWQQLSLLIFEGVVVPTGTYQKERALNSGRNYWTFDQNLSLTWQPDESYDFSLTLGYMVNTKNTDSQYRTGDEIHLDYFAGYYITKQLGLGVTGSYYRQVTPDTGSGVPVDAVKGEASSIGLVVLYNARPFEHDVTFSTKWLHEYNVNNHIPGDYVIMRTTFAF
jgi:hypothetical protein